MFKNGEIYEKIILIVVKYIYDLSSLWFTNYIGKKSY